MEFRNIPRYFGIYAINECGTIKRLERETQSSTKKGSIYTKTLPEKLMKSTVNPSGYLTVRLQKDGISKTEFIHKLVAETFLEPSECFEKNEVNHIDHNKLNNHYSNLEYVTRAENMQKCAEFYGIQKQKYFCQKCEIEISHLAKLCKKCSLSNRKSRLKDLGLTRDILYKELMISKNFTKTAEKYSVSCNALRKWCVKLGIPNKAKFYK